MNEIDIPRYVDSQVQLFFWEFDEAIVFISCLAGGIVAGGWFAIVGMLGGIFAVKVFKRFKNGALEGVLLHLCYWAGVLSLNKKFDDAAKREFYL
ncbi:type IV conjugative transfer system protein TraL [Noviherbaspirillum sp. CPCC 100848]|uniref:Type IV conjugative transfer system protein TraL n=1 Tax=Noviherbaspirillum album TaxID=3080276 RepID=A0ABU6J9Z1_9BURK|nr:type IV conjugative transfer system protein TraL [Noviherbaspirillum sp. CPCC 100848]MEC4720473.1 type IV conjugative transfer system protein TraL [Noviherbaspirillum sp. CPCC 100848]